MYDVRFRNIVTTDRFGSKVPEGGLVYSPLTGVSHSNRLSLLTVRGLASKAVATIAKSGDNEPFIKLANLFKRRTGYVKEVVSADGPTLSGGSTTLRLKVDCARPFITVIGMLAPTPDWIVQINNRNMFNVRRGQFTRGTSGTLIAYDGGVDSGGDFTDPKDATLDILTNPQENIAPLVEDSTDPFMGQIVGRFTIRRVDESMSA